MRIPLILTFLLLLTPALAQASGLPSVAALATHGQSSSTAKPAPTIIPGSPLAALTGATPTPPQADTRAPFGTRTIGFALSNVLGDSTLRALSRFGDNLQRAIRLTPVFTWLHEVSTSTRRHSEALAILRGFLIAIVPGLIIDRLVAFLLRRPARFFARRATPRETDYTLPSRKDRVQQHSHTTLSFKGWCRRALWALLKFFVMLLPLAAFLGVELYCLASGLVANRAAHLALNGFTNAYICIRLIQDCLRLLFSPKSASLRLIRIPTPYAQWAMKRGMILAITSFLGFCLVSCAEILGLSDNGSDVLIRLVALVVHLELALWIWQSRRVVARWIAGRPHKKRLFSKVRQGLAQIWYILALLYVIALWVAFAIGVHNALLFTLRAIFVVFVAFFVGRMAQLGIDRLFQRLFPEEDASLTRDLASASTRVKAYSPLLRFLVRAVLAVVILSLVLEGWGVDAFDWLFHNNISRALLSAGSSIVITATVAILFWEVVTYQLDKRIATLNQTNRTRQATRLRTLSPILRAALAVVVVMLALIIGLSRIGVNTSGLLAVSSVVGIAVGFGSQKLVQDMITGLFLLFEDAIQVGDSVTLGGLSGTVERLSIRTIRLRGGDGSVNIIPFSSVSTVTNQTRDFSLAQLSIMVDYKADIERVIALLKEIGTEMRADPGWDVMIRDDIQIFGLDSFAELGLVITGQIRTGPGQNAAVRREFHARVQKRFSAEGIDLPYRHQSLQLELPPGLEHYLHK